MTHTVVPYDRAVHEGFVRSSWTRGARRSWRDLQGRLCRPDVACLVAHVPGAPDDLLGWACVDYGAGAVVWAYVRSLDGGARRRGICRSLLAELGVSLDAPTPCLYWSPDAAEMAARGCRLIYAPRAQKEAA